MDNNTFCEVPVRCSDLEIDEELIINRMGYEHGKIPEYFRDELIQTLLKYVEHCRPRAGYIIFHEDKVDFNNTNLRIDKREFNIGSIISSRLRNSTRFALFVATGGREFEEIQTKATKSEGLEAVYLDTIGTEIAERCGAIVETHVTSLAQRFGWKASNRYSPGYCHWHTSEQLKLFSLFPKDPLGVQLLDSGLMIPRKSITGLIGIGKNVKKEGYSCQVCDDFNCLRRIPEFPCS